MDSPPDPLLSIRDLRFGWPGEDDLLDIPSFELGWKDSVFLEGPSGSGKSTLLGLITGILSPRAGTLRFDNTDLSTLSPSKRDKLRADRMGVVFQLFNLLPYLSVIDNVLLPCRFSALRRANAEHRNKDLDDEAKRLLDRLGLRDQRLLHRKAGDLSVGQQQRVAAARALIGAPDLIIADEPTSALDTESRNAFIELLMDEAADVGATLLFVSHDMTLADHFARRLSLTDLNKASVETRS